MELRHLRYFVTVAEELNLTRAAAKLRVAQPALSRQIHNLEEELQAPLFERTRAGVLLTRAGRAFYPKAQIILRQTAEAAHEARTAAGVISGRLVIGYPSSVLLNYLAPLVSAFRAAHPTVELDFVHVRSTEQQKSLSESVIDVGFTYLPPNHPDAFEKQVIGRAPFKAVLPAKHQLASQRELRLSDLRHEDFVFFSRDLRPGFYDRLLQECTEAGFHPHVVKEVGGHWTNILGLVSVGLGISVMPYVNQMERINGIVWRPLIKPRSEVEFILLWRNPSVSGVLAEFIQIARAIYGTGVP